MPILIAKSARNAKFKGFFLAVSPVALGRHARGKCRVLRDENATLTRFSDRLLAEPASPSIYFLRKMTAVSSS